MIKFCLCFGYICKLMTGAIHTVMLSIVSHLLSLKWCYDKARIHLSSATFLSLLKMYVL